MGCIKKSVCNIMRPHEQGMERSKFNFYYFDELSNDVLRNQLTQVYTSHENAFKINLSFGYLFV